MKRAVVAGLALLLLPAWSWKETRRCAGGERLLRARGAYAGAALAAVARSVIRHPGDLDLAVPGTHATFGLHAGGEIICGRWGGSAGATYWGSAGLGDLRAPERVGGTPTLHLDDARFRSWSVELQAFFFPWENVPVGASFLFGAGATTASFTASEATAESWNRAYSDTRFRFVVGAGLRAFVLPHVSVTLEGRLLPGNGILELQRTSSGCAEGARCYTIADASSLSYTRLFALGLSVSM